MTVAGADVADTFNVSPRAGFAYDLTGDNRTVLKGYYGRFYFNSADDARRPREPGRRRAPALPVPATRTATACSTARRSSALFRSTQGGAGFVDVDDNIKRPYSQEISAHLEREIVERPVGPRLLRLQERPQRVGRDRPDARRRR